MVSPKNIVAVLGPTNTGKTHHAIEQMLAHKSGMIGLPLRLLAREVYDRVSQRIGPAQIALITGEEKIIPQAPKFWICTTEAMPSDLAVEFLAVDEIQLCADFERGHVFTDRLLHRRGTSKTMFLGADTMRDIIARLIPDVRFETHSRLSRLTYNGEKKISRLPPRSAIIGFSGNMVYSLAELVRRQRGGAAVIMGNLSPRTRNAQVGLYQSGEVNYLVATDAIGMGLNMDIEHVSFASLRKFDGFSHRNLSYAELGQIAGRAGRHKTDGTFGVTGQTAGLDAQTVENLENHKFDLVKFLQWRNVNLNFSNLDHLAASFKARPGKDGLVRARPASDITALEILSLDESIQAQASDSFEVKRLWDVCQLPDYRNISAHEHAGLIAKIYKFISGPKSVIDTDWFAKQLSFCDMQHGDIDTLSNRISHIRTWTFVANRSQWLDDPVHWQGEARKIEDALSDSLHQALTQRFIDRATSVLMKKIRQKEEFMSSVEEDGTVLVESEAIGKLIGFRFVAKTGTADNSSELKSAGAKVVSAEIAERAASIIAIPDQDLQLTSAGTIIWQKQDVGHLAAGESLLKPQLKLYADDSMTKEDRSAVLFRIQKFVDRHLQSVLAPIFALLEDENITGIARGVAFRIVENLGVLERSEVADDIKSLDQTTRGFLRKHGIRFGAFHIFLPILLKPAATELRVLLWALKLQKDENFDISKRPSIPGQGLTSTTFDPSTPPAFFQIAGYKICGTRIVRIDMLERLGDMIRARVFWRSMSPADVRPDGSVEGGGFSVIADMMSLVGCSGEDFSQILTALGYKVERRDLPATPEIEEANDNQTKPALPKTENNIAPVDTQPNQLEQSDATPDKDEPTWLEVWWPRDTGPFKSKKARPRPASTAFKKKPGKNSEKKPLAKRKSKPTGIRPQDSPFAALQALKQQLKK